MKAYIQLKKNDTKNPAPEQEYEQFVHLSPKNRQRAGPISGLKGTAARTIKLNALDDWENKVA